MGKLQSIVVAHARRMDATPKNTPARTPKSKKDTRPTLTLKGDEFGPEFRALINKAAQKVGSTQSAFVADTLTREAQRILKGLPESNPQDTPLPPAVMTHRLDAQEKAIADLADQVKRLTDIQQLGFWQRVRLLLAPSTMPTQPQAPFDAKDAA